MSARNVKIFSKENIMIARMVEKLPKKWWFDVKNIHSSALYLLLKIIQ
jgi:hypothetical protein